MTPQRNNNGVFAFLRVNWWQLGVVLIAVLSWVWRAELVFGQIDRVIHRLDVLEQDKRITEGLGRLQCLSDRSRATTAGLPCSYLLNERIEP